MTKAVDRALYGPVAAGYVLGFISVFSIPVLIGSMMAGFGITETQIGIVVSVELAGIAASSLLLSGKISHLSLRNVALTGCIVAVVGHGLAVAADALWFFVVARAIAGFGEGAALAAANGAGAAARKPDKVFAVAQIAVSAFTMILVGLSPFVIAEWGYRAGILGIMGVFLLCVPAIFSFPAEPETVSAETSLQDVSRFPNLFLGILTLAAFALMSIADVAMWVFTDRIGFHIGVSSETTGLLLSIATGLGLFGAFLAAVLSDRFGRLIPISIALLLLVASNIGLGHATSIAGYTVSLLPLNLMILFLTPYFLGTLSELDVHGSWTAASGVIGPLAFAAGPLLAGLVIVDESYAAVGWLTGGCAAVALIIMTYVLTAHKRGRRSPFSS